jgi:hypothetical protein
MAHSGERSGFTFECVAKHLIAREVRPFESDRASQTLIYREVNFSHPAFSDEVDNEVTVLDQSVLGKRFHLSIWVKTRTEGNLTYIFQ